MMSLILKVYRYCSCWFLTLMFAIMTGLALLVGSAMIPQESMSSNQLESSTYLLNAPYKILPVRLVRDNYTDSIMLFMGCCLNPDKPLSTALSNTWYTTNIFYTPTEDLHRFLTDGKKGMKEGSYSRYWHGYLSVLQPLLTVMNYQQIRYANYAVFTCILLYLCHLVKKKFSVSVLYCLLASMLYASIFFVPQSLQYSSTFYIALIGSILVIRCPWPRWGSTATSCLFVLLGAATSYMDFLVTPIVTLGFPVIFVMLRLERQETEQRMKVLLILIAAWFVGYVGMWGSKWILCALLTDCDVASIIGAKLAERSIGSFVLNCRQVCAQIIWFLPDVGKLWWFCVFSLIFVGAGIMLWHMYKVHPASFKRHTPLLVAAGLPFTWLLITINHTLVHIAFTHRMWSITIFAVLVFIDKIRTSKK